MASPQIPFRSIDAAVAGMRMPPLLRRSASVGGATSTRSPSTATLRRSRGRRSAVASRDPLPDPAVLAPSSAVLAAVFALVSVAAADVSAAVASSRSVLVVTARSARVADEDAAATGTASDDNGEVAEAVADEGVLGVVMPQAYRRVTHSLADENERVGANMWRNGSIPEGSRDLDPSIAVLFDLRVTSWEKSASVQQLQCFVVMFEDGTDADDFYRANGRVTESDGSGLIGSVGRTWDGIAVRTHTWIAKHARDPVFDIVANRRIESHRLFVDFPPVDAEHFEQEALHERTSANHRSRAFVG